MSIVLDSPHKLEGIEPVKKPKYSPALQLTTPSYMRIDPPWWQIELAVRSCHGAMDGGFGEFCVLSQLNSNIFIQTAVCLNEPISWRLEWRVTDSNGIYTHYFAIKPSDHDDVDTVENTEIVIMAFKAFYQNKGLPDSLTWKRYDI